MSTTLPVSETLTGGAVLLASTVFNWWSNRERSRAYAQGAVDRAMEKALEGVSAQLARADERLTLMDRHREECETELEVARVERATLKRRIDGLMSGPTAAIYDKPPKDF